MCTPRAKCCKTMRGAWFLSATLQMKFNKPAKNQTALDF
jgi:hypothetical protein